MAGSLIAGLLSAVMVVGWWGLPLPMFALEMGSEALETSPGSFGTTLSLKGEGTTPLISPSPHDSSSPLPLGRGAGGEVQKLGDAGSASGDADGDATALQLHHESAWALQFPVPRGFSVRRVHGGGQLLRLVVEVAGDPARGEVQWGRAPAPLLPLERFGATMAAELALSLSQATGIRVTVAKAPVAVENPPTSPTLIDYALVGYRGERESDRGILRLWMPRAGVVFSIFAMARVDTWSGLRAAFATIVDGARFGEGESARFGEVGNGMHSAVAIPGGDGPSATQTPAPASGKAPSALTGPMAGDSSWFWLGLAALTLGVAWVLRQWLGRRSTGA